MCNSDSNSSSTSNGHRTVLATVTISTPHGSGRITSDPDVLGASARLRAITQSVPQMLAAGDVSEAILRYLRVSQNFGYLSGVSKARTIVY